MPHFHADNTGRYKVAKKVTTVSAITNALLGVVKIICGSFGHSTALVADGIHSLADLLCDGLVLIASYFSHHDPDEEHPYGHRRFETAATFILGIVLLVIAIGIAYDAILEILHHAELIPDTYTIYIAIASLVVNEWLFRYTLKAAKLIESHLLEANAWHSRADALSSLIVLIGLLGALSGFVFLDGIAAVVVAIFIAKIGFEWGWRAFCEFTDKGLSQQDLSVIKQTILSVPGVIRMHQLRTRTMAEQIFLDVHILVASELTASEGHYVAESVEFALAHKIDRLKDVTVHVDVEEHTELVPEKLLPSRQELLQKLMPVWQTLIEPDKLLQVDFYYESNSIRAKVFLVLESHRMQSDELLALQSAFSESAKQVAELEDVTVFFRMAIPTSALL